MWPFIVYSLNSSITLFGIGQRKTRSSSQDFALPVLVNIASDSMVSSLLKVSKRNVIINIFIKLALKLKNYIRDRMVVSRMQC